MTTIRPGRPRPESVLLRLRLIGRMEALTLGNESVLPLGRKTRALLAILAMAGRQPVLRLRIAELLWSRRSEEQARASLRQEIHRLLEALGPLGAEVITVERHTLALKPALTSVDAERILTARPDHLESLPPIEGTLLEELNGTDPAFDQWLAVERRRLHDHMLALFSENLAQHRDPKSGFDAAQSLLALDGRNETAWIAAIRAQQMLGNAALARQLVVRCASAFEQAGTSPSDTVLAGLLHGLQGNGDGGAATLVASWPVPEAPAVRIETEIESEPVEPAFAAPGSLPEAQQPILAIIPTLVLSAATDPVDSEFAAGLSYALQTELIGNGWVAVLGGRAIEESLEQGRDDAVLVRQFGVRYVLDGTLQRFGTALRVILRLSDIGRNGQLLWAQRFDGKADDLFAYQDMIAARTAARVPAEIILADAIVARRLPEHELTPQRLAAVALRQLNQEDRVETEVAIGMLKRGLARRSDSGHLLIVKAAAHLLMALQQWGPRHDHAEQAEKAARAAIGSGTTTVLAMSVCAHVLSELHNRPEAAMALVEQALQLTPHAAEPRAAGTSPLIRLGQLDDAGDFFASYKAAFSSHPLQALLDLPEVMMPLLRGDHAAAARIGLRHSELRPGYAPSLVPYLAALGHLRELREAERVRTRLLEFWPDTNVNALVLQAGLIDPVHAERLRTGLELAGLRIEAANDDPPAGEGAGSDRPARARGPLGAGPLAG